MQPYFSVRRLMMIDDEIEAVAAELAKAGGVSWHSGRDRGPLKLVKDRYRDRARQRVDGEEVQVEGEREDGDESGPLEL